MKRMKTGIMISSILAGAIIFVACNKDFLEKAPLGSLDPGNLANSAGVQGLLIGAYSMLDGYGGAGGGWESAASNWVYGGVASDDAYKGSDPGDQPDIVPIETYAAPPTDYYFNNKWSALYDAIQRCNDVLRVMTNANDMTADDKTLVEAQVKFLRAHYHFEAKRMWRDVPFVDESITYAAGNFNVTNTDDIWPKIEDDLKFAKEHLPETWSSVGRVNNWAAQIYLGKTYLYEHKYDLAKAELEPAIENGVTAGGKPYDLVNFADNFNAETKNSAECVFSVQQSVNDGAGGGNAGWGDVLNFPYSGGPGGCCGFYQPSQSLVNSFRVDANGLPYVSTYNSVDVKSDQGLKSSDPFTPTDQLLDPRLDMTVGRRGIPYLDWGLHPGNDWIRDQNNGGPYSPIKNVYYKRQTGALTDKSFWTSGVTANNYNIIRFADVLLMAAECEVEVGTLEKAREFVNKVRARAADPAGWVKAADGSPNYNGYASNYKIGLYTTPWTDKNVAREAVRFERKLELAMEGHRHFDLARYSFDASGSNNGYMKAVIDAYMAKEKAQRTYFNNKTFTQDKNEYFPIPQSQIDLSKGTLTQTIY